MSLIRNGKIQIDSLIIDEPYLRLMRYLPSRDWNMADFIKKTSSKESSSSVTIDLIKVNDANGVLDDCAEAFYTFRHVNINASLDNKDGLNIVTRKLVGSATNRRLEAMAFISMKKKGI